MELIFVVSDVSSTMDLNVVIKQNVFYIYFHHRHVILHWPTKFRQNRTNLSGVMMSYRFFFKMAAGRHIGFDLDNIRPQTKCNCWSEVCPQLVSSGFIVSNILRFLYFPVFGWNCLFTPTCGGCGGIFPPKHFLMQKHVVWTTKRENRFSSSTSTLSREKNKKLIRWWDIERELSTATSSRTKKYKKRKKTNS